MKRLPRNDGLIAIKRGLSRVEAAFIVGVGVDLFDKMVEDRRLPQPARFNGRVIWDRIQIEQALDKLFDTADPAREADEFSIVMT